MFRKMILGSLLAACVALAPMMARGAGTDSTGTITVTATVTTFAEWSSTAPVTIALGSFGSMSGATNHHDFTLYANVDCAVKGDKGAGTGVLTYDTDHTIPTNYKISGDASGSASLLPAADFFDAGNSYAVTHTAGDGSYTVTLDVEALPSGAAPEAGAYTCELTLVASWS